MSETDIEQKLLGCATPIVGFIRDGVFLLDVRTLQTEDFPLIAEVIRSLQPD